MSSIWPSLKYEIRDFQRRWQQLFQASRFWQWQKMVFALSENSMFGIAYLGRSSSLPILKTLLGVQDAESEYIPAADNHQVSVYEFPMPFTIRVPHSMTTMVKLDRNLEEIMAGYSKRLRKSINNQLPDFSYKTAKGSQTVLEANETMLKPYAIARHDLGAYVLDIDLVADMALKDYGQLDVLYEHDVAVGCHLGNRYTRRGETYWHVNRLGYTEVVFSDHERWADINSMNLHLALQHAIREGYDYCDYGMSLGKAGGGLLEWKRRRKGFLAREGHDCFYLKPPKKGKAQFFWGSPVFSLKGDKVNLHLGVPAGKTEDEVLKQFRGMAYEGLSTVYLQCEESPSGALLDRLNGLYKGQKNPPSISVFVGD